MDGPPLRSFTTLIHQKQNPRDLLEGPCFAVQFRSQSVASALAIRSGATPGGLTHPNTHLRHPLPKPDISTLP